MSLLPKLNPFSDRCLSAGDRGIFQVSMPKFVAATVNLFFVSVIISSAIATDDSRFEACQRARCSNSSEAPDISFPFYLVNQQPPYCGYPFDGFAVRCRAGFPILNISGNDYEIREISYGEKSLSVRLWNATNSAGCIASNISNTTLPENFRYGDNTSYLNFFIHCEDPEYDQDPSYNEGCDSNWGWAYSQRGGNVIDVAASSNCDRTVVVPIKDGGSSGGDISANAASLYLRNGFSLNWTASKCDRCEVSGGRCGYNRTTRLFKCFCPDGPHWRTCDESPRNWKLLLAIMIPAAVVILALLVAVMFLLWRQWRCIRTRGVYLRSASSFTSSSQVEASSLHGVQIFSYRELQEATCNFDDSRELGDGGFGTVYYGKLGDGREVAVKRLYERNHKRMDHFMNEVNTLTCLRHPNLVSLYGCTSRTSRGLLLVYEYIPNGTLADHLHGEKSKENVLPWQVRMEIAVQTASALAYLHKSDIIHRDVKTDNILLDDHFCVKVADFGLSRLFPNNVSHVSTAPQGTPGYVDPEYHRCYQLTDKSDVYSFGVVLIELISSMPAVDITRSRSEVSLANLAVNRIQRSALHELIDPRIGFGSDPKVTKMTEAVAELAFRCLHTESDFRPSMNEIVVILKGIQGGDERGRRSSRFLDMDEAWLLSQQKLQDSPKAVVDGWRSSGSTAYTCSEG